MAATAPLPPQNLDAEESVLGAMMLSGPAIEAASGVIDAGDFYRESHTRIYLAAIELYQHGQAVDAITVADKLDERGDLAEVGGKERIHELAALVPATSNAGHYARIVRDMATLRGLTTVGEQIQRRGRERAGETPWHGQVGLRARGRGESRDAPRHAGGDLHARDVEGRGRPALHVLRGAGRTAAAADGPADERGLAAARQGVRHVDEGADLRRRHAPHDDARDPVEGAPPEGERAEARRDHRRLPAADEHGFDGREPRAGDRSDLARIEGDRRRPRGAGDCSLAAEPRRREQKRQAPPAVRPARLGRRRAGRRPRHVPL